MKINIQSFILGVIFCVVVAVVFSSGIRTANEYASSKYGSYCYPVGHIPKTIKNIKFHKTLSECTDYISVINR